ncbi:hypothetical protein [Burkholderia sp. BCC1993]|uniref:hypothetical protein n=1 Tax=Burkholderia sp. BCC1993 TaxID=2817444 RepID=UPI0039EF187C
MTIREADRLKVIEAVAGCRLKPGQAAERPDLSVRRLERLVARLREHGAAGWVSGHRSKPGNGRTTGSRRLLQPTLAQALRHIAILAV